KLLIIIMSAPIFKHKIILLLKHVFRRRFSKFYRLVKRFMQKKMGELIKINDIKNE
ncbi:MAG: hypothetical protein ACI8WT_003212, partial [Clostridium sp.]